MLEIVQKGLNQDQKTNPITDQQITSKPNLVALQDAPATPAPKTDIHTEVKKATAGTTTAITPGQDVKENTPPIVNTSKPVASNNKATAGVRFD